jgi:hypothetical protein
MIRFEALIGNFLQKDVVSDESGEGEAGGVRGIISIGHWTTELRLQNYYRTERARHGVGKPEDVGATEEHGRVQASDIELDSAPTADTVSSKA